MKGKLALNQGDGDTELPERSPLTPVEADVANIITFICDPPARVRITLNSNKQLSFDLAGPPRKNIFISASKLGRMPKESTEKVILSLSEEIQAQAGKILASIEKAEEICAQTTKNKKPEIEIISGTLQSMFTRSENPDVFFYPNPIHAMTKDQEKLFHSQTLSTTLTK